MHAALVNVSKKAERREWGGRGGKDIYRQCWATYRLIASNGEDVVWVIEPFRRNAIQVLTPGS
jgi:hypothetical protein